MPTRAVEGLAPRLPHHRPRARPRWWVARGRFTGAGAWVDALEEQVDAVPVPRGLAGLAAPTSLPAAFLAHLGLADRARDEQLAALAARTPARLCAEARAFARLQPRGAKHPARHPRESVPSLDRTRLPLHHAALPLLRRHPTHPWRAGDARVLLVEVDERAWLDAAGLPPSGLAGEGAAAIERRRLVLAALCDPGGPAPLALDDALRDRAVAAPDALRAIVALAAVARLAPDGPPAPAGTPPEAWLALP